MIPKTATEKGNEQDPLISGKPDMLSSAEHRLFQLSNYVNANSCWYLFFSNMSLCIMTIIAVSGAACFVSENSERIMPHCHASHVAYPFACNLFTFSFWTYPTICPVVTLFIIYKRLLETRLYYECLLNHITVSINESPVNSPVAWILVAWGSCAVGVLLFAESFPPAAQGQYFLPIITFLVFVSSKWNINSYLITLPEFCATDPEFAGRSLDDAARTNVSEPQIRCALENVCDELSVRAFQNPDAPKLSTLAFFGLLSHACEKEMSMFPEQKAAGPDALQKFLAIFGLVFRPAHSARFPQISRPEVMTSQFSLRKGFWAYRILFHEQLYDARSVSFRRWFRGFVVFAIFEVTVCLLCFNWILSEFLVYEKLAEPTSTLVWFLRLGHSPYLGKVKEFELKAVNAADAWF